VPKYAAKKTRAADGDWQNLSKLIPALKKMTKKPGEGNEGLPPSHSIHPPPTPSPVTRMLNPPAPFFFFKRT